MDNRASVSILIGGEIRRSNIQELAEAGHGDGAGQGNQGATTEHLVLMIGVAAQTRKPVLFTAEDPFLDTFDTLEAACRDLDLPYARHTKASIGTWGEHVEFWEPGMDPIAAFRYACSGDGSPMLDYKQIRRLLDAGALERELQIMERIHRFPFHLTSSVTEMPLMGRQSPPSALNPRFLR